MSRARNRAISRVMAVGDDIEWRTSETPVAYPDALARMEARAAAVRAGSKRELVWLLQHPPLFTAGTSADPAELSNPRSLPVYQAGRGGRYTYHGPGQRVVYLILDLERRGKDIRRFVHSLEGWMIAALGDLGVEARREPDRIGIWTGHGAAEAKIGAIGVRVKRWVTLHGCAVNVAPDLTHFDGIIPCGIADYGVTSLKQLGAPSGFDALDRSLKANFPPFLNRLLAGEQVA